MEMKQVRVITQDGQTHEFMHCEVVEMTTVGSDAVLHITVPRNRLNTYFMLKNVLAVSIWEE